ncbi:hypothetical protein ABT090_02955 [Streptomyces asoensis]|uniref:hypothetical protein n=1 Tax=Streptomyces asoensis TaxID=249586 RepID=UPI00331F9867
MADRLRPVGVGPDGTHPDGTVPFRVVGDVRGEGGGCGEGDGEGRSREAEGRTRPVRPERHGERQDQKHQADRVQGVLSRSREEGLPPDEALILRCADRLLARYTLSGAERAQALELLTAGQLADLVITVGFYEPVSGFLNTFGVTTEGETDLY